MVNFFKQVFLLETVKINSQGQVKEKQGGLKLNILKLLRLTIKSYVYKKIYVFVYIFKAIIKNI